MARLFHVATLAALLLSGCTNAVPVTGGDVAVEHESQAAILTEATFDQTIASTPVVMVDFWAPWCKPCLGFAPTVEALSVEYEGRAVVGKLNVDEARETANEFGVASIPTVIFFKNGQEVNRLVGVSSKREVAAILDSLVQ